MYDLLKLMFFRDLIRLLAGESELVGFCFPDSIRYLRENFGGLVVSRRSCIVRCSVTFVGSSSSLIFVGSSKKQ